MNGMIIMSEYFRRRALTDLQPPCHSSLTDSIERLRQKYGGSLEVRQIGRSVMGREIYALDIGRPDRKALYCGGVHGREWVTTLLLTAFAGELLRAQAEESDICGIDVGRMLDTGGVTIIPALNPDGVEISVSGRMLPGMERWLDGGLIRRCGSADFCRRWKANARGVDINRNFDSGWDEMRLKAIERGIRGGSPEGWPGEYPMSEPETAAVVQLCAAENYRHLTAFHSEGEVIYWSYRNFTPPRAHIMAKLLSVSSGYALGEPSPDAAAAGLKDWFMEKYGRPAFTVEVGRGTTPLPMECFPFLYNRLREMLVLGLCL